MKLIICYLCLIFSCNVSDAKIDYSNKATYFTSIISLSNEISRTLINQNIRELYDQGISIVPIEGLNNPTSLSIVINRSNLYAVGFVVNVGAVRYYYRFNDMTGTQYNIAGNGVVNLTMNLGSDYTSLQRVSGVTRASIRANRNVLSASATLLTNLPRSGSVNIDHNHAEALLRFIITISEAVRFPQISTWVTQSIEFGEVATDEPLGLERERLTNQWATLSAYAATAYAYDDRSYGNMNIRVLVEGRPFNSLINVATLPSFLRVANCQTSRDKSFIVTPGFCLGNTNITRKNVDYERKTYYFLFIIKTYYHDEF